MNRRQAALRHNFLIIKRIFTMLRAVPLTACSSSCTQQLDARHHVELPPWALRASACSSHASFIDTSHTLSSHSKSMVECASHRNQGSLLSGSSITPWWISRHDHSTYLHVMLQKDTEESQSRTGRSWSSSSLCKYQARPACPGECRTWRAALRTRAEESAW